MNAENIVALLAGIETALVHYGNVLEHKGLLTREELARSLEETADALPLEARNREVMRLPLVHIAKGLRGGALAPYDGLLH